MKASGLHRQKLLPECRFSPAGLNLPAHTPLGCRGKNKKGTQCLFGLIVCRRHTWIIQKDKPLVLIFQNSLLQCHCFFMTDWKSDQLQQSFSQPDLFGFLLSLTELSLLPKTMQATPVSDELPNGLEVREVC